MNSKLLDSAALQRMLARMAHEIAEANPDAGSLVLVGIQRGGVPVALRLAAELAQVFGRTVPCGTIDVTFYRDDLNQRTAPAVHPTEIPGDIQGKTVVLMVCSARGARPDDVVAFQDAWARRYADQGVLFVELAAYGSRADFDKYHAPAAAKLAYPVLFDPAGAAPKPA